jgi:hypothetical protein
LIVSTWNFEISCVAVKYDFNVDNNSNPVSGLVEIKSYMVSVDVEVNLKSPSKICVFEFLYILDF